MKYNIRLYKEYRSSKKWKYSNEVGYKYLKVQYLTKCT